MSSSPARRILACALLLCGAAPACDDPTGAAPEDALDGSSAGGDVVAKDGSGTADTAPVDDAALDATVDGPDASVADAALTPEACAGDPTVEAVFSVQPYVQHVLTDEAWILWETPTGEHSAVEWGPTGELGRTSCGQVRGFLLDFSLDHTEQVHEVQLADLEPDTIYWYRAVTGTARSAVHHFRTAPARDSEAPLRFVAMADSQIDKNNPTRFSQIINDGVIPFVRATFGPDLAKELGFFTVAGDLVDNGWIYEQWESDFLGPAEALMAEVPLYPVPGNHEGGSPFFWRYFRLPENGESPFAPHWYYVDYSNVRLIGLDSNDGFQSAEQLDFLAEILDDTCDDPLVDFVFAQLHHPYHSELWLHGNTDYTGDVIALLEEFSTRCDKPSVHLFGHTHAYSRGQSRDHKHLMVNVASAGGAIDRWTTDGQADYPEFSVSQDTWGFVVIDVEAGDTPRFTLRRVSQGNVDAPADNVVTDTLTVKRYDAPPQLPTAVAPVDEAVCADALLLRASAYADPDGDSQAGAHWQISASCEDFGNPVFDRWRQNENWYKGVDTQAGDDLSDEAPDALLTPGAWCWRVRYRDTSLAWSPWSAPAAFSVGACDAP
ncbi:MAG: metallophosphoesterase family protein [Deltaproteobacteria bacterium]|nr:metallophosphoesterase family protein [Deltaproteobacteria bacterium]